MEPGKLLIIAGVMIVVVGLFLQYGPQIPLLGKLPGDIRIQRDNFTFYAPIATSILLSIVASVILWLFRR